MVGREGIEPSTNGLRVSACYRATIQIKLLRHTPSFKSSGTQSWTSDTEAKYVTNSLRCLLHIAANACCYQWRLKGGPSERFGSGEVPSFHKS